MFGHKKLNGPRLPPARGDATHLVVLCHGYGADGNDLLGLAPHWQSLLPTTAFVAPNAPERCPGAGYQWFAISRLDPEEARRGAESAASALTDFLDAELKRLELPGDRLVLAGFSQGTMMALHVGLRRAVPPLAILGFSGMLAAPPPPQQDRAPPVLLIHGDADTMIPVEATIAAAAALGHAGIGVQFHLSPGLGHGIDAEGMDLGGRFLAMAVRGLLRPPAGGICCTVG
ncbi:MAG TPA: prolyl oligopeptidase family serine peptidase [Rhizomicrobium sp.]